MTPGTVRRVSSATVIGLLLVVAGADFATDRFEPPHAGLALKGLFLCGLLLWAHRAIGLSWEELGLARSSVRDGARTGLIAALCVASVIALLIALPATRSSFEPGSVLHASATERVLRPLVVIPLGTAVFEETIFRGVLLGVLLRRSSRTKAVVISSVAFGLWHLVPLNVDSGRRAVAALGVVAVTTAAGVLFAWLRLRSGSLLAPILAHVATNSFAYVAAVIVVKG